MSLTRTPSLKEFLYARGAIATAAPRAQPAQHHRPRLHGLQVGGPTKNSYSTECQDGKRMGFNGKQCIHPGSGGGTVSKVFSPELEEVEWGGEDHDCSEESRGAGQGGMGRWMGR